MAQVIPGHRKQGLVSRRMILTIVLVAVVGFALMAAYFELLISNAINGIARINNGPFPNPHISATLAGQDLLLFNSAQQYTPYGLIGYTARNVSSINANISIFKYAPPRRIYILNISNECYECGNTTAIENALYKSLEHYNIINSPSGITVVSLDAVSTLPPDSLLIILNGLLPESFLGAYGNMTLLDHLMNTHTSILYVGGNFSRVLLPDSVTTSLQQQPTYLSTAPSSGNSITHSGFYFNKTTFVFSNGSIYAGRLAYENIYNGSIAAFPNTPTSWKSPQYAGADIAKAVQELFWLPRYAYGTRTVSASPTNTSYGQFGVLLNSMYIPFNSEFSGIADNGSVRVSITANATYLNGGKSNSTYQYIYAKPALFYNGTLGVSNSIITNQTVPLTFTIFTHSSVPQNIQPHITIYTLNMTQVYTTPLGFIHNVSNNITIYGPPNLNLLLQPGAGYIVKLHSFYGTEYSAAFFNVSPISLYLVRSNITQDQFLFSVTSANQPINNIKYTLKLNGIYPQNGTITNGTVYYSVPRGTPAIKGSLNFTFTVQGGPFYYETSYNPLPFSINSQYIEVAAVVVVMLAMILFVRAPNRDEFYIDVPNLPEEKKTHIKLKARDVVAVFDKLNISYHWKYMPLSKAEVRTAVSSNIRYNNIPVGLTYSNIERILDQLTVNKMLTAADSLYAPAQWPSQSRHDMQYLATFKKLRMYLVTHAYIFTDMDQSTNSDIVATLHGDRKYIVIYSKTSKFQKVPVYTGSKTYIVFLNAYMLEEFNSSLYASATEEAEELKMYIDAGYVKLVDADNPEGLMN